MAGLRSSRTAACRLAILFALIGLSAAQVDRVRCGSSTGDVVIDVHHEWAPRGARRFMELVQYEVYDNSPLFRVVRDFIVQWGIPANPEETAHWKQYPIQDDANIGTPTKRGTIGFTGGPKDSRVSELWISFQDSDHIGKSDQEVPFAQIVEGMENVDNWYSGYGDVAAFGGNAPDQGRLYAEGAAYARSEYPELSFITTCRREQRFEEVVEQQQQEEEPAAAAQEPEAVADEILKAADEIQNQQQEAVAAEPNQYEAQQELAQVEVEEVQAVEIVEAVEAHEVVADLEQPPATEANAEPLSDSVPSREVEETPVEKEECADDITVTDLKTMYAWMKAKVEKLIQGKLPKLVHSPRDGEGHSHEDEVTAIIATVTLVIVVLAVSGSSGKKIKRL